MRSTTRSCRRICSSSFPDEVLKEDEEEMHLSSPAAPAPPRSSTLESSVSTLPETLPEEHDSMEDMPPPFSARPAQRIRQLVSETLEFGMGGPASPQPVAQSVSERPKRVPAAALVAAAIGMDNTATQRRRSLPWVKGAEATLLPRALFQDAGAFRSHTPTALPSSDAGCSSPPPFCGERRLSGVWLDTTAGSGGDFASHESPSRGASRPSSKEPPRSRPGSKEGFLAETFEHRLGSAPSAPSPRAAHGGDGRAVSSAPFTVGRLIPRGELLPLGPLAPAATGSRYSDGPVALGSGSRTASKDPGAFDSVRTASKEGGASDSVRFLNSLRLDGLPGGPEVDLEDCQAIAESYEQDFHWPTLRDWLEKICPERVGPETEAEALAAQAAAAVQQVSGQAGVSSPQRPGTGSSGPGSPQRKRPPPQPRSRASLKVSGEKPASPRSRFRPGTAPTKDTAPLGHIGSQAVDRRPGTAPTGGPEWPMAFASLKEEPTPKRAKKATAAAKPRRLGSLLQCL